MNTDPILDQFRQQIVPLIRELYKPEKIIVFGSHAQKTHHEGSDIDVILVSEEFSHLPFVSRMTDVLMKVPFHIHVDYICYTPEEFGRLSHTSAIIKQALQGPVIALG